MADVRGYSNPEEYMHFQELRPDYGEAISESINLAKRYLNGQVVADFCCGTGSNTKKLADKFGGIKKAILIDINQEFLNAAESSKINSKQLKTIHGDILTAKLKKECDLVLSIFAYHHVTDNQKKKYIEQAKSALLTGGIIVLTEIYIEDSNECIDYYKKLFENVPKEKVIPGLKEFLEETARSKDFEYKVSKDFADKQFKEAGFKLLEEVKIWPKDNSIGENEGTFVQIYKI